MSMVIYYRPLPPDDGAEVPLDLQDPRTKHFRFEPRFPVGNSDPEEMCYRRFGLAWTEITGADGPNGLIFGLFGEDCDEHAIAEGAAIAFEILRAKRGLYGDAWESTRAEWFGFEDWFQFERERSDRLLDTPQCLLSPPDSRRTKRQKRRDRLPLKPLVLIWTPDSRWIEGRCHGEKRAERKETIENGKWRASKSIEYDFIYREVNPYFAAWLWVWETFKPPGPMPPDLEPFRDITKAPRGVVRSLFHQDEDGSYCALVEPYVTAAKIIEPDSVGLVQLL